VAPTKERAVPDTPAEFDASRGYTLTRTYDAPRSIVWRAITEGDNFAQWWGAELQMEIHDWDLRVGGDWRGTMTYEGSEIPWAGRFVEIDAPSRIVMAITDQPPVTEPYELMTYTLSEQEGRTELVVRQSGGHLTDEQYGQAKEGTGTFLDVLDKVVRQLT
jgi:uncharacterized protein YndB with AHSA1/START domain